MRKFKWMSLIPLPPNLPNNLYIDERPLFHNLFKMGLDGERAAFEDIAANICVQHIAH